MSMTADDRKALFLIALRELGGNISKACQSIGVTRQCFYNWQKNDEQFSLAVKEIQFHVTEELLDQAEETIKFWLTRLDKDTAKWLLSRLGSKRGYGTKVELEHTGDAFKGLEFPDAPTDVDEWQEKIGDTP